MAETSYFVAGAFGLTYLSIAVLCAIVFRWDRAVINAFKKLPFSGVVYL